jgi:hypothetical protein
LQQAERSNHYEFTNEYGKVMIGKLNQDIDKNAQRCNINLCLAINWQQGNLFRKDYPFVSDAGRQRIGW